MPKLPPDINLTRGPHNNLVDLNLRRKLFLVLGLMMLAANIFVLGQELFRMKKSRDQSPYVFLGLQFSALKNVLKDYRYIGYFTDKDLDDRVNAMQFSQAQYTLAPIILDLNNTDHEWIILNCTTNEIAKQKIVEIGAVPVRQGAPGMILARNPEGKSIRRTQTDNVPH